MLGAVLVSVLVLVTGVALWLTCERWDRELAGIRCRGVPAPAERTVLEAFARQVSLRWPLRAPWLLSGLRVEWVATVRTSSVPEGTMPDGRPVAGSVQSSRRFPWSAREVTAVCSVVDARGRGWHHAIDSALAHELVLHGLSVRLGRGNNDLHNDAELEGLLRDVERDVRSSQ